MAGKLAFAYGRVKGHEELRRELVSLAKYPSPFGPDDIGAKGLSLKGRGGGFSHHKG
jgi:hypothetical protein